MLSNSNCKTLPILTNLLVPTFKKKDVICSYRACEGMILSVTPDQAFSLHSIAMSNC